jgi:hypothetical protein
MEQWQIEKTCGKEGLLMPCVNFEGKTKYAT